MVGDLLVGAMSVVRDLVGAMLVVRDLLVRWTLVFRPLMSVVAAMLVVGATLAVVVGVMLLLVVRATLVVGDLLFRWTFLLVFRPLTSVVGAT